ncbi:hypothetical protein CSB20_12770 [bacterium DOLZORAL124_64_63]|nr:MAG: hypothetical protein CSB20_12770 [bacterium DOLZORAL124_64_63]
MFALPQILSSVGSIFRDHPAGVFALALGVLVLLQSAFALGRARVVIGLPLVWGLLVLAGFLLNPFADATTLPDLQAKLMSFETLTMICVWQLVLACLSLWLGLNLTGPGAGKRSLGLFVVHVIPAPLILVAMLLVEQSMLTGSVGADPEMVGFQVGFFTGTLLLLLTLPALRWRRVANFIPHSLLSVTLALACMLVPGLQDPAPATQAATDFDTLIPLGMVLLGAALVGALGWWRAPRTLIDSHEKL